ncbi:MAG: hypothetical protein JWL84_877 [Rhodospirillales bacterium]|nr:hypothetical protein [Rhodospirillales bacterium]
MPKGRRLTVNTDDPGQGVPHQSFAALRNPGFRAFFLASALAMMADSIEHVISYWIMFQKFHSPALGGFAVLSHWLPFLLFSVYSGALADRFDPRRIIQLGMVLFMLASLAWGFFFVTDTLQMWQAETILVVHGFAGVLWGPASQLLLHEIVGPAQLQSAVRLNATGRYLGLLLGPAVGGGILLLLGPSYGIFLNALIYLPLALWLWKAPYGPRFRTDNRPRPAMRGFGDIVATVVGIAGDRTIVSMTLLAGAASFLLGNAYQVQMPEFAHDLGHGDVGVLYTILLAADAAGALLAGFALESRSLLRAQPRTAFILVMLWCLAIAGFAMSPTYVFAVGFLFAAGFLELSFNAMAQTLVQLKAPAASRGRVIGLFNMSAQGLRAFSGVTVGVGGSLIGIHWSLALSAATLLAVMIGVLGLTSRHPRTQ